MKRPADFCFQLYSQEAFKCQNPEQRKLVSPTYCIRFESEYKRIKVSIYTIAGLRNEGSSPAG